MAQTQSSTNAWVVLVGIKADLEGARGVSADRAQNLEQQLGLELFEASAKDNTHVAEVLTNSLH